MQADRNLDVVEAHLKGSPSLTAWLLGPPTLFLWPALTALSQLERHLEQHARAAEAPDPSHDPERVSRLQHAAFSSEGLSLARWITAALLLSAIADVVLLIQALHAAAPWDLSATSPPCLMVILGYHVSLVLAGLTLWYCRRLHRHEQATLGLNALAEGLAPEALAATLHARERRWFQVSAGTWVFAVGTLLPVFNLLICLCFSYLVRDAISDHERFERGEDPRPGSLPPLSPQTERCSFCLASPRERAQILGSPQGTPSICERCAFELAARFASLRLETPPEEDQASQIAPAEPDQEMAGGGSL